MGEGEKWAYQLAWASMIKYADVITYGWACMSVLICPWAYVRYDNQYLCFRKRKRTAVSLISVLARAHMMWHHGIWQTRNKWLRTVTREQEIHHADDRATSTVHACMQWPCHDWQNHFLRLWPLGKDLLHDKTTKHRPNMVELLLPNIHQPG